MFSFFKKLFNFRTTETNSGNKDKQVDLESTNDTHLSKKLKSNDNYQRGQSRKYSSFSSLNSNKTAFTSSDKSQCQSSRRAAKMITKLADSMFLQSDEEISDESDYVIEELSKYKNKPMNTPKMIKKPSKRDLKRTTIRFCQKCKTLKTIVGHVTKRKHCDRCKNILFYICSYCKEKCYASHKGWYDHENICNLKNASLKLFDVSKESIIHQCSNYVNIFNEKPISFNSIKSDSSAKEQDLANNRNKRKIEARSRRVHKKAITANKQIKLISYTRWIRRYCKKCQKIVKLVGISKIRNDVTCKTCSILLQFLCIRCHTTYNSNADVDNHFQSKCLPFNYKCCKCNFDSTTEKTLMLHFKVQHPLILYCDMCTYHSQFKANLKRHINSIHLQK